MVKEKPPPQSDKNTLFVRNLPFDCTTALLEEVFSNVGPLRSCFVVTDKETKKCRGYGYVKFADCKDAETALKTVREVSGRKIHLHHANRKESKKHKKNKSGSDDDDDDREKNADKSTLVEINANSTLKKGFSSKRPHLIVKNLSYQVSENTIKELFDKISPVESVVIPCNPDGKRRGFAFITCKDNSAVKEARDSLNATDLDGRKITVELVRKDSKRRAAEVPEVKTGIHKLIIRNLPFTVTTDSLSTVFSKHGNIVSTHIPTDSAGKKRGFGFVTFEKKSEAEEALKALNMKPLEGRPVAVDWALGKKEYQNMMDRKEAGQDRPSMKKPKLDDHTSKLDDRTTKLDDRTNENKSKKLKQQNNLPSGQETDTEKKECKEKPSKKLKATNQKKKAKAVTELTKYKQTKAETKDEKEVDVSDKKMEESEEVENSESAEEEDHSDIGAEEQMDNGSGSNIGAGCSGSEPDAPDASSGQDDTESEVEEDSAAEATSHEEAKVTNKNKGTGKKHGGKSSADISEERTLFIRNVGYETSEDDLEGLFSEFGEVSYVKVLIDPLTERSRGIAFVQFKNRKDAQACLSEADDDAQASRFTMDGRKLNVTLAISRESVQQIEKSKVKQPKDNRNLYLVREGMIREGTQAAEGISKADMAKRARLEETKRAKLKNPLIFVSTTRLCIHNIPVQMDNRDLKKLVLRAVSDKSATITECRIMRDLTRVNAEGVGKSRGYAFVDFSDHRHALDALRNLNNNPKIFTSEKRPIVEFSLENTQALQLKERRLQAAARQSGVPSKSAPRAGKVDRKDHASKMPPSPTNQMERPKGLKLGLPTHWGPKLRHKARPGATLGKIEKKSNAKRKLNIKERLADRASDQPAKKKVKQTADVTDSFDKLVSAYRSKISQANIGSRNASKWYD